MCSFDSFFQFSCRFEKLHQHPGSWAAPVSEAPVSEAGSPEQDGCLAPAGARAEPGAPPWRLPGGSVSGTLSWAFISTLDSHFPDLSGLQDLGGGKGRCDH